MSPGKPANRSEPAGVAVMPSGSRSTPIAGITTWLLSAASHNREAMFTAEPM